jgi:hypothetical protein
VPGFWRAWGRRRLVVLLVVCCCCRRCVRHAGPVPKNAVREKGPSGWARMLEPRWLRMSNVV